MSPGSISVTVPCSGLGESSNYGSDCRVKSAEKKPSPLPPELIPSQGWREIRVFDLCPIESSCLRRGVGRYVAEMLRHITANALNEEETGRSRACSAVSAKLQGIDHKLEVH
jgi:hypothetical protein